MQSIIVLSLVAIATLFLGCQNSSRHTAVVEEAYVHKYGMEVSPEDWLVRGESGQVISTLKNGVKVTKSYSNSILDGKTTYTFPYREEIEKEEFYSEGNLVREKTYYFSSHPKEEIEFVSFDLQRKKNWFDSSGLASEEELFGHKIREGTYYNPQGQVESRVVDGEGIRFVRDPYGQLIGKETVEGGEPLFRATFYPNKTPKEIIPFKGGIVDGEKKVYLPGGEPLAIETWVNGKQEGITILFENGEKVAEVPYVNGKKQGIEKRYKNETQVVQEISWVQDQKHGPLISTIGANSQTEWYFQGQPVPKSQYDRLVNPPKR